MVDLVENQISSPKTTFFCPDDKAVREYLINNGNIVDDDVLLQHFTKHVMKRQAKLYKSLTTGRKFVLKAPRQMNENEKVE